MLDRRTLLTGSAAFAATVIVPVKAAPRLRDLSDANFCYRDSFIEALLNIPHKNQKTVVWEACMNRRKTPEIIAGRLDTLILALISDECFAELNDRNEQVFAINVAGIPHYARSTFIFTSPDGWSNAASLYDISKRDPFSYLASDRNGLAALRKMDGDYKAQRHLCDTLVGRGELSPIWDKIWT